MPNTSETSIPQSNNGTSEEKGRIQAKAQELKERVATGADSATSRVGERIESISHSMRERAGGDGRMGAATNAMAERLEHVGTYLREKDVGTMVEDLSGTIRRHPMRSLLVGVGVGYLFARLVSRKG